jgi:hypothetical protein
MADTVRTRSQLVALFADNGTGQISAQDLRDFLISLSLKTEADALYDAAGSAAAVQANLTSHDHDADYSATDHTHTGDFTATVTSTSWDNLEIPIWTPSANSTVTSISVTTQTGDSGTVTFNVEKRTDLNSSGTNMEASITATAAGVEVTSIDVPGINADQHMVLVTGGSASTGTVDSIMLRIEFSLA